MRLGHQSLTKLVLTDEAGAVICLHWPGRFVLYLFLVVAVKLSYYGVQEVLTVLVCMQLRETFFKVVASLC